jgi:hypothetical protein
MGDHIPVVEIERTLKEAAVIGDQFKLAIDSLPNGAQGPKITADRFRKNDLIRPQIFPVMSEVNILDTGKRGDADLQVREFPLQHLEEKRQGDGDHVDSNGGDPIDVVCDLLISLLSEFQIIKTGGVDEVIETETSLPDLGDEGGHFFLSHFGNEEGHPPSSQGVVPHLSVEALNRSSLQPLQ